MCGICGIVDLSGRGVDAESLTTLRDSLAHRGPDAVGLLSDRFAGLAHRRLSIIDLSETGRQPLVSEDGSVWVVCNGEIYNHRDLRAVLASRGHKFVSGSDTEALVHGYEEWGAERLLESIKGMFAFAIWDARRGALWLARDRLGVKPAFFVQSGSRFLFASEPHGLYPWVEVAPDSVDRESLDSYLSMGLVPPGRAFVSNVSKLPPASAVRFDRDGLHHINYWDVPRSHRTIRRQVGALDELERRFDVAVGRRLESDVPVGVFLSGGIDSGLVTAFAARHSVARLRTYTAGFASVGNHTDERALALAVAERYETDHHELVVEPGHLAVLPRLIWQAGEPFADVSLLPTFEICKAARQEITVALSGDGGDESFCGYLNVYAAYMSRALGRRAPGPLRGLARRLLRYGNGNSPAFPLASRLATLLWYADRQVGQMYDLPNWWHSGLRPSLYSSKWHGVPSGRIDANGPSQVIELLSKASELEEIEQILYTDLHLRLPGGYLTKVDIASNAVALEVRSPFLDHDLVEYAFAIPPGTRMQGLRQKGLLRELAKRHLPPEIVRQRKIGFAPPLQRWLRGEWAPLIEEFVVEGAARRPNIFDSKTIRYVVDEFQRGRADHSQRLWALICLEIWWRLFVDRTMAASDEVNLRPRMPVRDH